MLFLLSCRGNINEVEPNGFWTCIIINIKCNPATGIQTTTKRCTNALGQERYSFETQQCPFILDTDEWEYIVYDGYEIKEGTEIYIKK